MKNSPRAAALGTGTRATGRFLRGRGKEKTQSKQKSQREGAADALVSLSSLLPFLPPSSSSSRNDHCNTSPTRPLRCKHSHSRACPTHTHTHIFPSSLPLESFPHHQLHVQASHRQRETEKQRQTWVCVLRLNIRSEPNFSYTNFSIVSDDAYSHCRRSNPPSIVTCRQKQDQKQKRRKNILPNPIIHDVKKAWFRLIWRRRRRRRSSEGGGNLDSLPDQDEFGCFSFFGFFLGCVSESSLSLRSPDLQSWGRPCKRSLVYFLISLYSAWGSAGDLEWTHLPMWSRFFDPNSLQC
jgi:hypothetical protein